MNKGIIIGFSALIIIFIISAIMYNNAKIKKIQNGSLADNNISNRSIGGTACTSISYNSDGSVKSSCNGYLKRGSDGYTYCDCSSSGVFNSGM